MYALILVGYVIYGGGQAAGSSVPSQTIVGAYTSAKACRDAMNDFDKSQSFKDVTNNMNEYRWGFICVPSGFGARS